MTFPYTPFEHLVLWSATWLSPSLFSCCWVAGAETDKYISTWVMQSTHSQNNSGRSVCWPVRAAEFTVCTHSLLFVSYRAGDVFHSRIFFLNETKKKLYWLCAPSSGLIVRRVSSMSMHENGKQNSVSQWYFHSPEGKRHSTTTTQAYQKHNTQ